MSISQQAANMFSKTGEALVLQLVNILATINGILLDVVLEKQFIKFAVKPRASERDEERPRI
jgi:hypothetical protein